MADLTRRAAVAAEVKRGFVVARADLLRALTLAFAVAPKKGHRDYLRFALCRPNDNGERLRVEGRDGGLGHGVMTEVPMTGTGVPMMLPREALAWLKLAKDDTVSISAGTDYRIDMACGDARASFAGHEPDEFPVWPTVRDDWSCRVAPTDLATMLRRAEHAAPREEIRYVIAGVLVNATAKGLEAVATDSRRMAVTRCNAMATGAWKGILPLETIATILRACKGTAATVVVVADAVHVRVHVDDVTVTSRMLDQGFPEYSSVIPKSGPIRWTVDRADLIDLVRLAKTMATEDLPMVGLRPAGDKLEVIAQGSAETVCGSLPMTRATGTEKCKRLNFNPRFLADALALGDSLNVTAQVTDDLCPMLLELGDGYRYVLMPISA